MLYYADRISDNIRKREPEGYLICVNVPIARSGTQQYQQDEIGESGEKIVTVNRPEEEVFSEATIASFEGMPVTNDHPDTEDGVNTENISFLQKGHCQNVRRGTGKNRDLLIADLVITDPQTIQDVLDGKREISCGYNYVMDEEDGKYTQRQIRGNHIAIVDKGRAGKRVCIQDSAPTNERSKAKMKKTYSRILAKMLAKFAIDAEPEELEEAVDAIEEITSAEEEPATPPTPPEPEEGEDEGDDVIKSIMDRLDAIEAKLNATDEDPEEDPLAKLEKDLDSIAGEEPVEEKEEAEEVITPDEDPDEAESHFVDPEQINEQDEDEVEVEEEEEEEPVMDCKGRDAALAAIKMVKPIIAKLPPSERKQAADNAVAEIRKMSGMSAKPARNDYVALKKARKKTGDSASAVADIGRMIMEKRNPNYKK